MLFFSSTAHAASSQFRGDIGAMIVDSDPVVKLVLLTLFIFSVFSWATIVRKWIMLSRARTKGEAILNTLNESWSMSILKNQVNAVGDCPLSALFHDAGDELRKMEGTSALTSVENRIKSQIALQQGELSQGLGFLASISNSSPFIGLFGTVWGIMDSFRDIGIKGSANLATVAPGISEALVATAAGLFVAIPAVLFYNYYTTQVGHATTQMERFQIDFMNRVRRGLDNERRE